MMQGLRYNLRATRLGGLSRVEFFQCGFSLANVSKVSFSRAVVLVKQGILAGVGGVNRIRGT
jgi:hypothetical protein